jgi:molybdopterin converting factor small subunit
MKGLISRLGRLVRENDQSAKRTDPLFTLPRLRSEEEREERPVESLNATLQQLLDQTELTEITINVGHDISEMVQHLATQSDWSEEDMLRAALIYGLADLRAEAKQNDQAQEDMTTILAGPLNQLEGKYAALKFQVFTLRKAVFTEEMHVTGVESMIKTFQEQIQRESTRLKRRAKR